MKITISILFLLRKGKIKANNTVPIYVRISLGGKRIEFSTGHFIEPPKWCNVKGRVKGTVEQVKSMNAHLDLICQVSQRCC